MKKIKAFLKKHSFIVVFLVAIIIAVANYLVYPMFISKDLELMDVPISKETLLEGTKVNSEMIDYVSISPKLLPKGIVLDLHAIDGKFVKENMSIPANGFFYSEALCDEAASLGNIYKELGDGEWAYTMAVPAIYDQNSNLKVGQKVDIYFNCEYEKEDPNAEGVVIPNAVVFGMLKEGARIISITGGEEGRYVTYALTEEEISLFEVAEHIASHYGGSIYPLVSYKSGGLDEKSTYYDMDSLRNWIKDKALIFEYPEILRNLGGEDPKARITEVETISDGGSTD